MRSYQVFAALSPEEAVRIMKVLSEGSPAMFRQAVDAAAIAGKARPAYLRKQPFDRRAQAVRRALARVAANPVADELLAVYFLECRKALLVEWLDAVGLEHDEGTLKEDAPGEPDEATLAAAVDKLRGAAGDPDDAADRELLLRAFAAQDAIDWPALEARIGAGPA